jgi:predicted FMN-binding regulatory protein PaiB
MDSTAMPKSTEADHVLASRADERLAHAYDQIARADEQLARLTEQLTKMEQEPARRPAASPARKPSRGRPALRGFIGLLAAACIAGVAFASQSSYGEATRPVIAGWVAPYLGSAWLPPAKPELAGQPASSGVRLASAAEAAPVQVTSSAQAGPQDAASPAAGLTPAELTQLLQGMARDLVTVQEGIEQLKASQGQLASDNAKAVEQFKASQEQMTRLVAKVSEQEQRVRLPAPPPPRPIAEPVRRPAPAQASSQARAQPMQLQPAGPARRAE